MAAMTVEQWVERVAQEPRRDPIFVYERARAAAVERRQARLGIVWPRPSPASRRLRDQRSAEWLPTA